MGGGGEKKPGQYMGSWGALGSPPQRGIITYGLAQNRQRALAGAAHSAVFNTYRRTKGQILYWAVPLLVGYELMNWATEKKRQHQEQYVQGQMRSRYFLCQPYLARPSLSLASENTFLCIGRFDELEANTLCSNEYLNSKQGRLEHADDEEE
ncbi:hypothetical protein E4T42_01342 [Aureobasidium subglaciale]|nr:hypothetical protein E4T38_02057 [Aureobasidium subglaciale]KAI5228962.1 hypothetical protein E4T40_01837 [Aureobasidium subglaciale]KAI5232681.1 hypothetical protein E4T41_02057 [Aureobasidium subglaciale]KAI5256815.1 hypothetical protein E4T42_01342 [Aureobasidium subglaciale]KAI5266068.1 hypothetical protein E4T46_01834 [Aureobasidium subglaciale]